MTLSPDDSSDVVMKEGILRSHKKNPIDPLSITESLGFQTFRRESRKPWTKQEDDLLRKLVVEAMAKVPEGKELDSIHWDQICLALDSNLRKPKDCRKRWSSSLDPNLRRGRWTQEEDDMLRRSYEKHGTSWQKVALEIVGRTDDQCAKRYIEVLDPNTKDRLRKWDRGEDLELIRKVKKYGTKWRTIALEMNGRPSLTCRNRWRKIVTDVVRGKAELAIRQEVDLINGTGDVKLENLIKEEPKPMVDMQRTNDQPMVNDGADATPNNYPSAYYPLTESNTPNEITRQNTPITELSHALDKQPFTNSKTDDINSVRPDPAINLSMYTSVPNRANTASPRPVRSKIDWKYSLQSPQGEDLLNGFGNINSQDSAQRLIDLSKKHGISITVHQHITHHYAPQQLSILEPETQLSRYQHFNYLPPLTEVPKLNSSHSSPPGSSSSNSKESDLMKILNNDQNKNGRGNVSGSPSYNYTEGRSPKRSKLNNHYNLNLYETSRQQLYPSSRTSTAKSSDIVLPKPINSKAREDEMDFWETMKSFTQNSPTVPSAPSVPAQPQPTRYPQSTSYMPFNYHPSHQQSHSDVPDIAGMLGAIYGYNEEDEEEDVDDEVHPGIYHSMMTNNNSGNYNNGEITYNGISEDESMSSGLASNYDSNEFGASTFGMLPFNPS